MTRPNAEQWGAALHQLRQAHTAGQRTTAMVRLVAAGLGVSERAVWLRLAGDAPAAEHGFQLSPTDRAAFTDFRGNVTAVHRARTAVLAGRRTAAGLAIADELAAGWAGAEPVSLRTLQRAFAAELTPAQAAAAAGGDRARRAKLVYLRRAATWRNQVWEGDHKNLPVMVLPPRGPASSPWVTMFVDDATRVITGWAIALTPHAGTVLTALRMGMLPDDTGPSCGVPGMLRLDHGLEFAADSVRDAAHALGVEVAVMPAYHPNAKGKIERANRSVDQILLSMLPGFLEGPRELSGRLSGPLDDRPAAVPAVLGGDVGEVAFEQRAVDVGEPVDAGMDEETGEADQRVQPGMPGGDAQPAGQSQPQPPFGQVPQPGLRDAFEVQPHPRPRNGGGGRGRDPRKPFQPPYVSPELGLPAGAVAQQLDGVTDFDQQQDRGTDLAGSRSLSPLLFRQFQQ